MALKTLTPDHRDLQQISICVPVGDSACDGRRAKKIRRRWVDLDRFLVQLWESNTFHTRIIDKTKGEEEGARKRLEVLLPEMTKRGIVELTDQDYDVTRWAE